MPASYAKSSIPNLVSTAPEKTIPSPALTFKPKPKPPMSTSPQLVANSTEVSTTPVFNATSIV